MLSKAVHEARDRGYVTANDLATRCGVHRTTVSLAIRSGKLQFKKVGHVFLVAQRDADVFASQYQLTKPTAKKTART